MTKIKVVVGEVNGTCTHSMKIGDYFIIKDYKIKIPEGKHVCMWALNSLLPIFPLLLEKEQLNKNHWIKDAQSMQCPDGKVRYYFKIID